MGCGGSNDSAAQPGPPPPQQGGGGGGARPGGGVKGWGQPGNQVQVQAPNPSDPPFMQTAAPSGTSWGQYVRCGNSFVDPKTGFLSGPWAECVAWAVVYEHSNDWGSMPQYAADGVVGGVLTALENSVRAAGRDPGPVMEAAQRLEDASHLLAEKGQPLPVINQCVNLPQHAVPGQPCKVENPQAPGTFMTVQVPPNAQPGQPMMAPAPMQPVQGGVAQPGKQGMSTGTKVAYAAGGALAVGAVAGAVYYGTAGGGVDGFVGDMGTAGGMAEAAGGDAAGWAGDTAAGIDTSGAEAFAGDAGDWAGGAVADVGEFGGEAFEDAGGFIEGLF